MSKKRIMIVGSRKSGKSSIANCINDVNRPLNSTQDVIYGAYTMDTPSAYLEVPYNYKFLVALGQEANVLLCVIDATEDAKVYPPCFVDSFNAVHVGVITKVDQATEEQLEYAKRVVKEIGVEEKVILAKHNESGDYDDHTVKALQELRQYCRV